MKNKMLLALAGFLIVSMLMISPASAQGVIYRANGTLDEYHPDIAEGDRVVVGSWRLQISEDGELDFKARYLEENGPSEIEGTLDKFGLTVTEVTNGPRIIGDNCEFTGNLVFNKTGWDTATGKPKLSYFEFPDTRIVTAKSGIWIYLPIQEEWSIKGSTLSIHYQISS